MRNNFRRNPNLITEISGLALPDNDGLVLYNNDLYIVSVPNQVSQVRGSDSCKTAAIVRTDTTGYDQATINVPGNGTIYNLNARIGEASAAIAAKNPAQLQADTYCIQQFK